MLDAVDSVAGIVRDFEAGEYGFPLLEKTAQSNLLPPWQSPVSAILPQ
jgi:hypothetical protein